MEKVGSELMPLAGLMVAGLTPTEGSSLNVRHLMLPVNFRTTGKRILFDVLLHIIP